MKNKLSENVAMDILQYLATKNFDDEVTKYKLWQDLDFSKGSIYKNIPIMEEEELLKSKKIGEAPTGHDKKIYTLTIIGLLIHLHDRKSELWEKIDEIAVKQVEVLPLLFGKWDRFSKPIAKNILISELKKWFMLQYNYLTGSFVKPETGEPISPEESMEEIRLMIMRNVINIRIDAKEEEKRLWVKAIIEDPELSQIAKALNRRSIESNKRLRTLYKAFDKALARKDPDIFVNESPTKRSEKDNKEEKELLKLMLKLEERVKNKKLE